MKFTIGTGPAVLLIPMVFALWGPKLGGLIDLMVIIPMIILVYFSALQRAAISNEYRSILIILIGVFVLWQLFSSVINGTLPTQVFLRNSRAVISTFVLSAIFFFAASRGILSPKSAIYSLVFVLSINSFVIYFQILVPQSQEFFSEIWGYNKSFRRTRAFGLTTGFDTAGFFCVLGASSSIAIALIRKSWLWTFLAAFFFVSILLTSRTAMLMGLFLCLSVVVLLTAKSYKNILRVGIIAVIISISGYQYVAPRLIAGISELRFLEVYIGQIESTFADEFAVSSYSSTLDTMLVLPQGPVPLMLGFSELIGWSDIGYVQLLHLGGLGLVAAMLTFYFILFFSGRKKILQYEKAVGKENAEWAKAFRYFFALTLILIILGSFKNLYILTRGYHELFVICTAFAFGFGQRVNREDVQ